MFELLMIVLTVAIWGYLIKALLQFQQISEDRDFEQFYRLFKTSAVLKHYPELHFDPELSRMKLAEIYREYAVDEQYNRIGRSYH